jgi:hypothetical protein
MKEEQETLRDVFAGLCAMGLIIRGIPNESVASKAYDFADRLMEERSADRVGLPAIKKRQKTKEPT